MGSSAGSWVQPQALCQGQASEPPPWPPAGSHLHGHGQGWLTWKVPTSDRFRESLILHRDRGDAIMAVPTGRASPTLVPPVDGWGGSCSLQPSSSPLYPVPNSGTSPPHLCPQELRAEASPAPQRCSPSVPAHSQAPNNVPRCHIHNGRDVGCLGGECRALAVLTPSPQPSPAGAGLYS